MANVASYKAFVPSYLHLKGPHSPSRRALCPVYKPRVPSFKTCVPTYTTQHNRAHSGVMPESCHRCTHRSSLPQEFGLHTRLHKYAHMPSHASEHMPTHACMHACACSIHVHAHAQARARIHACTHARMQINAPSFLQSSAFLASSRWISACSTCRSSSFSLTWCVLLLDAIVKMVEQQPQRLVKLQHAALAGHHCSC